MSFCLNHEQSFQLRVAPVNCRNAPLRPAFHRGIYHRRVPRSVFELVLLPRGDHPRQLWAEPNLLA